MYRITFHKFHDIFYILFRPFIPRRCVRGALGALLYLVVLGFFARPIFALLGGTGEALEGAVIYAAIAFGGATATWAFYLLSAILRGTGDTVTPARAIVVGCAVQVPLSGILTLGWGSFSGFGIAGPAIAMVVCHGGASEELDHFCLLMCA